MIKQMNSKILNVIFSTGLVFVLVLGSAISVMARSAPGESVSAIIHRGSAPQITDRICIGSRCNSQAKVEVMGEKNIVTRIYKAIDIFSVNQGHININGGGSSDAINVGGGVYLADYNNGRQDNLCVDNSGIITVC